MRCMDIVIPELTGYAGQEQIQIIATAMGKPMPSAAAIVDANANSKSSSGCTLSSSGMAYSTNWKPKAVTGTKR
jgi:hypothetical protein